MKGYSTPRGFSWIENYKLNLWNNIFEVFSTSYKVFKHILVAFGMLSSAYAVWLKSTNALVGRFQPNNLRWLYTIFSFANLVWKLLPSTICTSKISNCVKYSTDAYHRYIFPRYILLSCFGTYIPVIIRVIPSMLCFPGFLTVSYRFPWCFHMLHPVFRRFLRCFYGLPQCFSGFLF